VEDDMTNLRWLLPLGALAFGAVDAAAQPAATLAELQPKLKTGTAVTVTDDKGVVYKGWVTGLTADKLEIKGMEREKSFFGRMFNANWNKKSRTIVFTDASLRRIKSPDATWDGMLIGGAIGTLMGWGVCSGRNRDETCPIPILGLAVVGGYFGNGFDASIDSTVYRSKAAPSVTLVPMFARRGGGIAATIRF
jgi:hypothetical protein